MNFLKLWVLAWAVVLPLGAMADMNRSAYSYENCDAANNSHSIYLKLATDQYAQIAFWGNNEINVQWKLLRESKGLFFLRSLEDESHTKTIFMNKDLYYVVDEKKGGTFRIKDSILQSGNKAGQKVGVWLNCPNESVSGAEALSKLKAYTAKLRENKRQAEADRWSSEFANELMIELRKQCRQFESVKERCATAGNYQQCMKILLPAIGTDPIACLTLK